MPLDHYAITEHTYISRTNDNCFVNEVNHCPHNFDLVLQHYRQNLTVLIRDSFPREYRLATSLPIFTLPEPSLHPN